MTGPIRDAVWQTIHDNLPPTDDSAELAADELRAAITPHLLPKVDGGCCCTPFSQSAGGVYTEYLLEYDPACPEHSEHVYNPRTGVWELPQWEREMLAPPAPTPPKVFAWSKHIADEPPYDYLWGAIQNWSAVPGLDGTPDHFAMAARTCALIDIAASLRVISGRSQVGEEL